MVDSIGSAGGLPPVSNSNRVQGRSDARARDDAAASAPVDEVSISSEALELAQAEERANQLASETRTILEQRIDEALSGENVAEALNALDVGE